MSVGDRDFRTSASGASCRLQRASGARRDTARRASDQKATPRTRRQRSSAAAVGGERRRAARIVRAAAIAPTSRGARRQRQRATAPRPSKRRRPTTQRRARSAELEPAARRSSARPTPRWSASGSASRPLRAAAIAAATAAVTTTTRTTTAGSATASASTTAATTAIRSTRRSASATASTPGGWSIRTTAIRTTYGGGYGAYSSRRLQHARSGRLKLKVKPRTAKVYVDGYFVGTVDQFDGAFQKLTLNGGQHKVEIRAEGYETAEFDVLITPEKTVTFQGELKRRSPVNRLVVNACSGRVAAISGIYDAAIGLFLLLAADRFAALFGVASRAAPDLLRPQRSVPARRRRRLLLAVAIRN